MKKKWEKNCHKLCVNSLFCLQLFVDSFHLFSKLNALCHTACDNIYSYADCLNNISNDKTQPNGQPLTVLLYISTHQWSFKTFYVCQFFSMVFIDWVDDDVAIFAWLKRNSRKLSNNIPKIPLVFIDQKGKIENWRNKEKKLEWKGEREKNSSYRN